MLATVETEAKYAGYIRSRKSRLSGWKKPKEEAYLWSSIMQGIPGLSREVVQKLSRVRPETLGQARRIPGVTPAAIAVLDVYLSLSTRGGSSVAFHVEHTTGRSTLFHVKQHFDKFHEEHFLRVISSHFIRSVSLARIISVANQKGGVGKTTTAINLAASLAASELKVLLIDSDPQGNSTTGLGIEKPEDRKTIYHLLIGHTPAAEIIVPTVYEGLSLIPADKNLVAANLDLVDEDEREKRLRTALQPIRADFDYIVIDCPPALDLLTLNALVASDSVLVPIQCEFFALEGISQLMDTVERVRESFDQPLELEGVLLTMYDDRTNLTRQVEADLREFFGVNVFHTVIPRNVSAGRSSQLRQTHPGLRSAFPRSRKLHSTSKGNPCP